MLSVTPPALDIPPEDPKVSPPDVVLIVGTVAAALNPDGLAAKPPPSVKPGVFAMPPTLKAGVPTEDIGA